MPAVQCDATDVGSAPLRRLTSHEYAQSIAVIFPEVALPELALPEVQTGRFDNDPFAQGVNEPLVQEIVANAESVATVASQDLSWLDCSSQDSDCAAQAIKSLGLNAFRRPLSDDELDRYQETFAMAQQTFGSFEDGLSVVIEAVLQSPSFLYRPEVGQSDGDAPDGLVALSGFEMASRLAYLLLGSQPDRELLDHADELTDAAGLEHWTLALLERPEAKAAVSRFHQQWLQLKRIEHLDLDAEAFPEVDDDLRHDLALSAQMFVDDIFWSSNVNDYSRSLLQTPNAFVNDDLASVLGVEPPGSDVPVRVTLPASERAGLLTQPGLLASTSHGLTHSPIFRGLFVLESLLCQSVPAPAESINTDLGDDALGLEPGAVVTTRERIERAHLNPECVSCHSAIDPIGFAFEHYDALGRYRDTEFDLPIDASGVYNDTEFNGAIEFSALMSESDGVAQCVSEHWVHFAVGRPLEKADRCRIEALAQQLQRSGNAQEMLVSLVTSPLFRFIPKQETL